MTKQLLLIVLSIASVLAESPVGRVANRGQIPYEVSLQVKVNSTCFKHICGGAILTKSWILTSARCYNLHAIYRIVAGITALNDTNFDRRERNISKFILHPEYRGWDAHYTNDIALIELDEPFRFNRDIKPIQLPEAGSMPDGYVTLSGWGRMEKLYNRPDTLQYVEVPVGDVKICISHFPEYVSGIQSCAGLLNRGACIGDVGGPLVQDGEVVGVLSYGSVTCAEGQPQVFTVVGSYVDFINLYIHH